MKKIGMVLAIVILLVVGVVLYKQYFAPPPSQNKISLNTVRPGTLVVATDATYPPLESIDAKGQMVGLDIDIAKSLAQSLGLQLELKNVNFDNIFGELSGGKVDVIISSVTITPERQLKFAFSNPYLNAGQVVIVSKDSDIKNSADLRGKKIGAQLDTTSLSEGKKLTDPKLTFSYPDYDVALKDLLQKKIDALIIDYPAGANLVSKNNQLKVLGEPFTQEFYGVVIKKTDTSLLTAVNESIATMKMSGKLSDIRKKWGL